MRRIPSLDGLRAISITAVIAGHLAASGRLPIGARASAILDRLPHIGVRFFFVLSGFLITTLILQERERTGTFSLAKFYVRRAWRILPPAYALLASLLIADSFHLLSIPSGDYARSFLYVMNYGPVPNWYVGHLWSLSVEEQFYLAWPFLMAFFPIQVCRALAVAFILVSAVLRFRLNLQAPADLWRLEYQFQYAGTAIVFGCLLALERERLLLQPWFRRICALPFGVLAACAILLANAVLLRARGAAGLSLADIITNLVIVFLIAKFTVWPVGPVFRLLNWKPVVFVGGISYSLYLWQQVFCGINESWAATFPINLGLITGCALGSYYLIEQPVRRLREARQRAQDQLKGRAGVVRDRTVALD